jgi:anti-sigma regulatory factor (Ser/Thr protein kinase)
VDGHASQLKELQHLLEEAMLKASKADQRLIEQSQAFKIEHQELEQVEQEARAANSSALKKQARLVDIHTTQQNKLKHVLEEAVCKATELEQRLIEQIEAFKIKCQELEQAEQEARAAKSSTLKKQATQADIHTTQLNELKHSLEEADQKLTVCTKTFNIQC